ncbi:carbohydrate kinase [Rhodobacterales bacterium HKCCE2091]|nr:carbohydrate kinase [Rhodobacterales bacterium HKCCE2091]
MTTPARVAVIDIGKTNAKLALVDTATLAEIAVRTRPNTVLPGSPWPRFDLDGHWAFLLGGLAEMHNAHGIDAVSVTTHGASAVLLDAEGRLAAPMLDYEHPGPDTVAAAYDAIRPDFAETGSPRLPMGLNLGAQLHWQFQTDPDLRRRKAHVLTYPQYWGYRLTGEIASDVTSLGCHTDLWDPHRRRPSALCDRLGIADKLAPPRLPGETLGTLSARVCAETGMARGTPVAVGIHDSNASLLPHLLRESAPFSVVSTGTWVVSMAVGGAGRTLDPARDTLVNVNAEGDPVPSARFMGGREYETLRDDGPAPGERDLAAVLRAGPRLLPSVVRGSGPFPTATARWTGPEPAGPERGAAVAIYLALMTATCLDLVGHRGTVLVEGPFARNAGYLDMLGAATGSPVRASAGVTGTSQGASLLVAPNAARGHRPDLHRPTQPAEALRRYAEAWMDEVRGAVAP